MDATFIQFTYITQPPVPVGSEFHTSLASTFTFIDERHALRASKKTMVVKLPPLVPPRCLYKVKAA